MGIKQILTAILFSMASLGATSIRAQQPLVLSLDAAMSYALDQNKSLVNSKYAVDKSSQKIKETISQGLPQVNAALDYTDYLGAGATFQFSDAAPPTEIKFNPTSNLKATVTQLLFNGNYFVGVQLSKLAKTITEQSYQKDALNVKELTAQAYYMVLASERLLKIIRQNKTNAELIYEKTKNLANAGMIEETDAKKLSIMVNSVDNAIKSYERQLEMGYNLLRLQLGLQPGQAISLSTTLEELSGRYILPSSLADTFNIESNQDFRLISMQGEMAKKTIELRKANYLPTLSAYYSYTEKLRKSVFDINPKNVLGLSLNVPIFSSGQRSSQLNQAKIDYDISRNTRELLQEQLTIQERQLRYNYENLYEQYLNQKANTEVALEVLEKMKFKYQQGIISSLELTSANSEYLTAESSYTGLLLQLLNAELSIRKINSKL